MELHVVYRITASDGPKPRPPFYSKDRCLASFLRAVEVAPPDSLTFLHDGPSTGPRRDVMAHAGTLIELPSVGNSGSCKVALSFADSHGWADDDLVYFAEDDYLYQPNAIEHLVEAAGTISDDVGFFTLYDHPDLYRLPVHERFRKKHPAATIVGDYTWRPVRSTTMTFAARVGHLRRWTWLFVLGCRDSYPLDFAMWSAMQGAGPYVATGAVMASDNIDDLSILRGLRRRLLRRRPGPPLFGVHPSLATQVEVNEVAAGADWPAIAADAEQWLQRLTGGTG